MPQLPAGDPQRPQYHFLPPANWMNDPNGLIQWHGQYHMFYQYNPRGPYHDKIHWGHAVSRDLVRWEHWPIALAPTPGGPDQDGCYSGCAVEQDGTPWLIYTGVSPQVQCIASSRDGLRTWEKYPGNPVLAAPPADLDLTGQPEEGKPWDFRDPWVWREDGAWYMLLASGIRNRGGVVLLYRSPDLAHWDYLGPLLAGDRAETGEVWECPGLFELDGKHVLLLSVQPEFHHTYYFVGTYREQRFTPEVLDKTDYGAYFYAAQMLRDERGRSVIFGWLKEGRSPRAQIAAGWSGVMSLPRRLALGGDGRLRYEPVPELAGLRGECRHVPALELQAGRPVMLDGIGGASLELAAEFEPGEATECGLILRHAPDGAEATRVFFDRARGEVAIDRERSSLSPDVERTPHRAPMPLLPGERLQLHIFLDHSVLEVFANGRACLTTRIYPTRPDSLGIGLEAHGGRARLAALDAWPMHSIWNGAE